MKSPRASLTQSLPAGAATAPDALEHASGASSSEVTINLPWPPRITHQNGRPASWQQRAAATKAYRKACAEAAWKAGITPIETWTVASIEFRPPSRGKYPDKDGMIGGFKAGQDGIADAMGADDGEFWPDYIKGERTTDGAVVVKLKRLEIPG